MIDFCTRFRIHLYRRSIVLLSTWAPLNEFCSLLSGGATVDTCNGNSIVFRTVIQIDGDVFTIVADSDGTRSLWDAHAESVAKSLAHISDQLDGIVRRLTLWVGIGVFGVLAWCWRPDPSFPVWGLDDWLHLFMINILMPMVLVVLGRVPVVKRAVGGAFLRTIPAWLGLHERRGRIEVVESDERG